MNQLNLPKIPKFYLTSKKDANTPSPIFMVIRVGQTLLKFSTGVKVCHSHWDKDSQRAIVSNLYHPLDNFNNRVANEKIYQLISDYKEVIEKLCEYDFCFKNKNDIFVTLKNYLKDVFMDKKKNKNIASTNRRGANTIVRQLSDVIAKDSQLRESTKSNYLTKGMHALKAFMLEWEEKNERAFDYDDFDTDFMLKFKEWLPLNYLKGNDCQFNTTSLNDRIRMAGAIIKKYSYRGGYISLQQAKNISYEQFKDKNDHEDCITLRNDEVMAIHNFQCDKRLDEIAKDMFVLQCTLGVRSEDMCNLNIERNDDNIKINFIIEKSQRRNSFIPLFTLTYEILEKYNYHIPSEYSKDMVNRRIKAIAKAAGIHGIVKYSQHIGGQAKVVEKSKKRWECVSTHVARRTFVGLLLLRGWNFERIRKYTGQTLRIMQERYDKITTDDINRFGNTPIEKIVRLKDESLLKEEKSIMATTTTTLTDNESHRLREVKQVLAMLGVPACEFEDIEDFDKLRTKLSEEEHKLLTLNPKLKISDIKTIFNETISLTDRAKRIKELQSKRKKRY